MPAPYYAIIQPLGPKESVLFLAINTESLRRGIDSKQLRWIKNQLQNTKALWKIVYGHHPIYSSGDHGDNEYLKKVLDPILVETRTDLYLAGHDHILEILKPNNGVLYVIAGGGGGKEHSYPINAGPNTVYGTTGGGFLNMSISSQTIRLEMQPSSTPVPTPYILNKIKP
jgi:acid phosphatase